MNLGVTMSVTETGRTICVLTVPSLPAAPFSLQWDKNLKFQLRKTAYQEKTALTQVAFTTSKHIYQMFQTLLFVKDLMLFVCAVSH